jgi:hypothetical protein
MDNSHVALVAVKLSADGFKKYRCDRPLPLGVNLNSLTKVLKCAKASSMASSPYPPVLTPPDQDDDACILKASDDADILNLTYESRSQFMPSSRLYPSLITARLGPYRRIRHEAHGHRLGLARNP